jgi:hypothetical protein
MSAIKSLEYPLQLAARNADSLVLNSYKDVTCLIDHLNANADRIDGVLNCVVDEVGYSGTELLRVAIHQGIFACHGKGLEHKRLFPKVMTSAGSLYALADNVSHIELVPVLTPALLSQLAGPEDLFDSSHETLSVRQHHALELTAFLFVNFTTLKRFQVEAYRRYRRLQFVRNSIDEAVVLLVSPNLTDEENSIQRKSGDDDSKQDNADHDRHNGAPVNDPCDIQDDSQRDER